MELAPLTQFICDVCKEIIVSPSAGWLEWRCNAQKACEGLRIVHHATASPLKPTRNCYYSRRERDGDVALNTCTGPDGLIRLLSFFVDKFDGRGLTSGEAKEAAEIIRRLHVPGYEEARSYFGMALQDGYIDSIESFSPHREAIERLIARYRSRE